MHSSARAAPCTALAVRRTALKLATQTQNGVISTPPTGPPCLQCASAAAIVPLHMQVHRAALYNTCSDVTDGLLVSASSQQVPWQIGSDWQDVHAWTSITCQLQALGHCALQSPACLPAVIGNHVAVFHRRQYYAKAPVELQPELLPASVMHITSCIRAPLSQRHNMSASSASFTQMLIESSSSSAVVRFRRSHSWQAVLHNTLLQAWEGLSQ